MKYVPNTPALRKRVASVVRVLRTDEHSQRIAECSTEEARWLLDENLAVLLMIVGPILALLVLDPDSFVAGWNEGRGGLIFAVFFSAIEWYDLRSSSVLLNRRTLSVWSSSLALLAAYYAGIQGLGLREALAQLGRGLGLPDMPKMFSWISLCEFTIYGLYLTTVLVSSYGLKNIKKYVTPIAYLFGMAFIFLLDAAFPYNQLGVLQAVVLFIVPPVEFLLNVFGVATKWYPMTARLYVYHRDNTLLVLRGALDFYWPCVGVHSMIIFTLIIIVLIAKLEAPARRKIVYAVSGAIGTVSVNIIRVFSISYILAIYGIERAKVFHEFFGEILFLAWVIIFLVLTIRIEDRLALGALRQTAGLKINANH